MPDQSEVDATLDAMVDDLFKDGLSALEQRQALQQQVNLATDIERDIAVGGPLFLFLRARRKEALAALESLVHADAKDVVAVTQFQSVVKEYLRPCHWIAARRHDGENATEIIKEEYPTDGDEPDRHED